MKETKSTKAGERAQFSPAPWRHKGALIVSKGRCAVAALDPKTSAIFAESVHERNANARLIKNAPELFAFVKDYFEVADCGDGGEHDEDMSHGRCWHCTARRLVNAVIKEPSAGEMWVEATK